MEFLVHWTKEGRWDVLSEANVPTELRFEGALGLIQYNNGKRYLGKVIKISDVPEEIEEAETKLSDALKAEKEALIVGSKRKSRPAKSSGTASANQLAKALNERPVLTPAQREAKRQSQEAAKKLKEALQRTEEEQDNQVVKSSNHVNRQLFKPVESSTSTSNQQNASDALSDEDVANDQAESGNEMNNDDGSSSDDASESDPDLNEFMNPNTEAFLKVLLAKFGSKQSNSTNAKVFVKPRKEPGQKMVHLKKGHSLKVSKGMRNMLVLDKKNQKSASNFTRKVLSLIYGDVQLGQMTAMGRKKNSISISPADLSSIYGFVTEYCSSENFKWTDFTKTINKKCSSHKTPSPKHCKKKLDPTKGNGDMHEDVCGKLIASPLKFKDNLIVTAQSEPKEKSVDSIDTGNGALDQNSRVTTSPAQPKVLGPLRPVATPGPTTSGAPALNGPVAPNSTNFPLAAPAPSSGANNHSMSYQPWYGVGHQQTPLSYQHYPQQEASNASSYHQMQTVQPPACPQSGWPAQGQYSMSSGHDPMFGWHNNQAAY